MNKVQKVLAGLLGVVVAELAVVDWAVIEYLRNGLTMEVNLEEVEKARELVESEIEAEGGEMLEEELGE